MRIGFDAKKAVSNLTGIGNYSRRCIDGIAQINPSAELVLFAPHKTNAKAMRELTAPVTFVRPENHGALPLLWWRNWGMCKDIARESIDIFHGLSNEIPFGIHKVGCKTVVTIHDLIFRILPDTFGWADRQILTAKTRYACQHADCIIAVSECTKRDIVRLYGTPAEKIKVVYQSISDEFRNPLDVNTLNETKAKYALPDKYILCVGTIERRKNAATIIKALKLLPEEYHVVLVGRRTSYAKEVDVTIEQSNLHNRVHILKGLSNIELPAIYQLATVFALMSRYEGFGIPIAEAAASGVPIIAATGSCLEEAGGPDCLYIDPDDVQGLADAILRIEGDKELRQRMIDLSRKYSERFTDEQQAKEIAAIYNKIFELR